MSRGGPWACVTLALCELKGPVGKTPVPGETGTRLGQRLAIQLLFGLSVPVAWKIPPGKPYGPFL